MHLNQLGDRFRDEYGVFETTECAREAATTKAAIRRRQVSGGSVSTQYDRYLNMTAMLSRPDRRLFVAAVASSAVRSGCRSVSNDYYRACDRAPGATDKTQISPTMLIVFNYVRAGRNRWPLADRGHCQCCEQLGPRILTTILYFYGFEYLNNIFLVITDVCSNVANITFIIHDLKRYFAVADRKVSLPRPT